MNRGMEHYHEVHNVLEDFLFVGCWNKNGCRIKDSPQTRVAEAISHESPSLFLVLGGDNVYPDKPTKTYNFTKVRNGLACFKQGNRSVLSSLGNHNIKDSAVFEEEMRLGHEKEWFLPNRYYTVEYSNKKAIVVLDSNLFDEGDDTSEMIRWLRTILQYFRSHGINYYLVQHHPVISYKKSKLYVLPDYEILLEILVSHKPIMILVADTHNYQKGVITYKGQAFTQIVSGTGGADLDSLESLKEGKTTEAFSGTYEVRSEDAAVSWGYQRIRGSDSEFVEVEKGFAGGRRKQTRRH